MRMPGTASLPTPRQHRPTVLSAGALVLCSVLLLALVAVEWRPLLGLDGDIARTTHRWAVTQPGPTRAARILTDWVWDPWTMRALCGGAGVLLWRCANAWTALWLLLTVAFGTAVQQGVKAALGRARPVWPDPVGSAHYAAFPSGHAMTAAMACGLLLWLLRRHGVGPALWRTALIAAVVSVAGAGLTRIWLGVHWPTDVLGGWLFGSLVAMGAVLVHRRWLP